MAENRLEKDGRMRKVIIYSVDVNREFTPPPHPRRSLDSLDLRGDRSVPVKVSVLRVTL